MFKAFAQHYASAVRTAVGASGVFILSTALGRALLAAEAGAATGNPATAAATTTAREFIGPAAVVQLTEQGPAKIVVDPPLAEQLTNGLVFVQYRTENLRVLPVFGPAALAVSPRIGHLHAFERVHTRS